MSLEFKKQIQKEKKLQKNLEPKENNTTNEIKEPISNTNSNDNQKVTVQTGTQRLVVETPISSDFTSIDRYCYLCVAVGVISKQQLKVPPISPNKKRTEEMIVTEYFIEEDDKEIPYRYPEVVLTKTAPDFAYIRIHRREVRFHIVICHCLVHSFVKISKVKFGEESDHFDTFIFC